MQRTDELKALEDIIESCDRLQDLALQLNEHLIASLFAMASLQAVRSQRAKSTDEGPENF